MKIGDKVKGRISGIQTYGAFIELENGQTGLIHISEIKTGFVDTIRNHLKIGQEVLVQVIDVDEYTEKVSLSLRSLEKKRERIPRHHRFTNERNKIGFAPLAEALPGWVRDTKDYLTQLKRIEEKKGK